MGIRTLVLAASLAAASWLGATTARANAVGPLGLDAEVERHATLGQRYLERGDAQGAVAEFRRAYELRADARFLFDIGESYERLGNNEQARFFYDRYLSAAPEALDREEVEERLEALDKRVVPASPAPPAAAPPASFAHDLVVIPVAERPPAPAPLWKRWWVWATFGAAVAGSAVAFYTLGRNDTRAPSTALGDKTFY